MAEVPDQEGPWAPDRVSLAWGGSRKGLGLRARMAIQPLAAELLGPVATPPQASASPSTRSEAIVRPNRMCVPTPQGAC